MKRLFRKDNRIARFIAMWLVFIMALTPLYEHSGLKNPTKAATGTLDYAMNINVLDYVTADENGITVTAVDDGEGNISYAVTGDATVHNLNYLHEGKSAVNITGTLTGALSFDNNTNITYESLVKVYDDGVTPDLTLGDTTDLTGPGVTKAVDVNKTYAIYIKVSEFNYGTDNASVAASTNNKWHLLTAYKFKRTDFNSVSWVDDAGSDITKGSVKEAYAPNIVSKVNTGDKDLFIGEVKYYYAAGSSTNYSTYAQENIKSIDAGAKLTVDADGSYALFAEYKADSDENVYRRADIIEIDTQAPVINKVSNSEGYFIQDNQGINVVAESDGVRYLDLAKSSAFTIKFYTKELNAISSQNVDFYASESTVSAGTSEIGAQGSITSDSQLYVEYGFLPSGLEKNVVYEVKATLVDEAGNDNVVSFGKICVIDTTFTVDYKIDGTKTTLQSPASQAQKLVVNVSAGNKLGKIKVYAAGDESKTDDDVIIKEQDISSTEKKGGIYNYTGFEVMIPSDTSQDKKYNNIKLEVTAENETTKVITLKYGDFIFDATEPNINSQDITFEYGKYNDYSSIDWDTVDTINEGKYVLDVDEVDVIRYGIKVDDGENGSGIKSVKFFREDEGSRVAVTGNTWSNNGRYYIEISSQNLETWITKNGLFKLCVVAEDNVEKTSEMVATPGIILPTTEINITSVKLTEASGNKVDINENNKYYDNEFTLTVSAESGYKMDQIVVYTSSDGGQTKDDILLTEALDVDADNEEDKTFCVFKIEKEIKLPKDVTVNQLMENIYVEVRDTKTKDDNGVEVSDAQTRFKKLGTLLHDATLPVLLDGSVTDGQKFKENLTWVNGEKTTITALITPGNQAVESKIVKAYYSIDDGEMQEVSNGYNFVYPEEGGEPVAVKFDVDIPESKVADGTKVTFYATDEAGNSIYAVDEANVVYRRVDNHDPHIDEIKVNGVPHNGTPIGNKVTVDASVWDNLSLKEVVIDINPDNGTVYNPAPYVVTYNDYDALNNDSKADRIIKNESEDFSLEDGDYKVVVTVTDKAGRKVTSTEEIKFTVDSKPPVLDADITTALSGNEPGYYKDDKVVVTFTCEDRNDTVVTIKDTIDNKNTIVVNDKDIKWISETKNDKGNTVRTGVYEASKDGAHVIVIEAKDIGTENSASTEPIRFTRDTKAPVLSAIFNGFSLYNEGEGVRLFTSDTVLGFSEDELNKSTDRFYYQLTKEVPDEAAVVGQSKPTSVRSFSYNEEAVYTVQVYSIDKANNRSVTKRVQFRIDKTAPNINIGGIASGGTSSNPVTISLNMQELYWSEATGTVEIYKKSGEGFGEELVETINYTPTGRSTSISRNFAESGIYRIEFNANDSAGHTSTASSTFTIDTTAPKVTLSGVSNYDVTDKDVTIESVITENFYASKKVTITGTVTDETGKVSPIVIDDYSPTANPTTINKTFTADGIYDLTITCVDIVGNSDSKSVHFVIDKSKPVIGDLSDIDGKILTSFDWSKDLDELVSDLTVCDVHMYLNGQEYNGEDAVEDGSYILLITAEDELGHKVEKEAKFTLDTKAPVFIVTGVEDDEKRIEPYNITVSLQLDEDTLTSVTLNGEVITINGDTATFDVTEIGEYKLYMEAVDEAGNKSSAEYEFELESENQFNLWWILGILAMLAIVVFIIILVKRKKDEE